MVHVESADSVFFVFVACSCVPFFRSVFPFVFTCREFGVRSAWVLVVNCPRCLHGWSVSVSAVLEVCESFSDSLPVPRGRSAVGSRTVHPELADSPPGTAKDC
jgi:hypothetical protein